MVKQGSALLQISQVGNGMALQVVGVKPRLLSCLTQVVIGPVVE